MQSRNNGLANFDGGIFLARIIEEDEEADQWNTDQDQNGIVANIGKTVAA
jgi:hypothetical protein